MKYKQYLDRHNNGTLSDTEWEDLTRAMLGAHFDREKQAEWAQLLAQNGVVRQAPRMRFRKTWRMLAAASVLIATAITGWLLLGPPSVSPAQRLAIAYMEKPFEINAGAVRGEKAVDINRGRALEAFSNREYEKAYRYLRLVETEGQAKAEDFFQMGLCLMYRDQPEYQGALNKFNLARQSDAAVYVDEIDWFSGLCHLLLGDTNNAEASFQKVAGSASSRNRAAAEAILKALRE